MLLSFFCNNLEASNWHIVYIPLNAILVNRIFDDALHHQVGLNTFSVNIWSLRTKVIVRDHKYFSFSNSKYELVWRFLSRQHMKLIHGIVFHIGNYSIWNMDSYEYLYLSKYIIISLDTENLSLQMQIWKHDWFNVTLEFIQWNPRCHYENFVVSHLLWFEMSNGLTKLHCANNDIWATRDSVASIIRKNAVNSKNKAYNNAKHLKFVNNMTRCNIKNYIIRPLMSHY